MADKIDGAANSCTFQWKLENISHCWLKPDEKLDSPRFIADGLQGTNWFLRLYPLRNTDKKYISLYLRREVDCSGPDIVTVGFEIAVLDKDGAYLQKRIQAKHEYLKNESGGFHDYETWEKVFVTQKDAFLPDDTLTVQCKIWNTDQNPVKTEYLFARTTFGVNRRNFMFRIDSFSTLKCDKKHTFKDGLIEFDLALKEGLESGNKLVAIINSFDESTKYFSFKASIIDSGGEKENCCNQEYFEGELKKGVVCTLLLTKKLTENRSRYLPNDVLTLDCEYVSSKGTVSHEHYGCGTVTPKLSNELQNVEGKHEPDIEKEKPETMTVLAKDLIAMYNDRIFSDIEIRTSTQTFPSHMNILSARSPVFRKMLSNDMKEKISGHVDIDDLEDDTVHQMLLYMYTNSLDLQYENACKLYVAADKYEILSLRDSCASFMKNNLSPNKACDVLALADRHEDDDLKSCACDFILKHAKEVFGLQEWKDFMNANNKLALDVTYQYALSKI